MKKVVMYSTLVCPYCMRAESFLKQKGVQSIEKILLDDNISMREEMVAKTGRKTVPQIFIGDAHVGGFDDLVELDRKGKLDAMLNLL